MEGLSLSLRRSGIGWTVVITAALLLVMVPQVSSVRYIVGSNMGGWSPNVNYTIWAQDKHFYNGDWLFFVYDRNQMNVLEVNKTDFESCNSDHPLHNWTTGAGRDVVPLNVTKTYYFISGKGFCWRHESGNSCRKSTTSTNILATKERFSKSTIHLQRPNFHTNSFCSCSNVGCFYSTLLVKQNLSKCLTY